MDSARHLFAITLTQACNKISVWIRRWSENFTTGHPCSVYAPYPARQRAHVPKIRDFVKTLESNNRQPTLNHGYQWSFMASMNEALSR